MNERERAYKNIREAITCGQLSPGERLVELSLCETFEVGRTPIREALRQLQMEGYVEVVANKGAFVKKLTLEELWWIYGSLAVMEAYAAELLAQNHTGDTLNLLYRINAQCVEAREAMEWSRWFTLNNAFHDTISKSSGNPVLSEQIEQLRNRIYRNRNLTLSLNGAVDAYITSHEAILEALAAADSARAAWSMRDHLEQARENLRGFLTKNQFAFRRTPQE